MTHDELRDLSGGYALGALDETDRRAFEAHLPTCPDCAEEVRAFATVASGLALAVPQVDPPVALRERVLRAAIASDRPVEGTEAPRSWRGALVFLPTAAALVALALGLYAASLNQRIRVLEEELRLATARAVDVQRQLVQYRVASDRESQVRAILCGTRSPAHRPRRPESRARCVRPGVLESRAGARRRVRQSAADQS